MNAVWPAHFPAHLVGRTLGSSGLSSYAIALEAWRRGLEVTFGSNDLRFFSISDGQRTVDFDAARPESITRHEDYAKLSRKSEVTALLREVGLPSPLGFLLDTATISDRDLEALAVELEYPVVLKPEAGSMGIGVLTGLRDWGELKDGYVHLTTKIKARKFVLEKHQQGDDYRILVVGDRVIGAVRRVPAHVIGNGVSNIEELILDKNRTRKRNPFLASGLIKVDYEVLKCLESQGLGPRTVPDEGKQIALRRVANASAGGDVIDVTDTIPDEIKQSAVRAVNCFPRVLIAGVDVLYHTGRPATPNNYVIIELNSRPHIGVNMYPTSGRGRDVPNAILNSLFPGTLRPKSSLVRTIRFNEKSILATLRAGAASKVTLPPFPEHLFPYRRKFRYGIHDPSVPSKRLIERTLQKLARELGVSGSIQVTDTTELVLIVAAEKEAIALEVVRKVSEMNPRELISEEPWTGPITVGFIISQ